MRKITVTYETGWYGRFRKIAVLVDSEDMARMKQGSSIEITIPDDAAELQGRIDWGITEPFPLAGVKAGDELG